MLKVERISAHPRSHENHILECQGCNASEKRHLIKRCFDQTLPDVVLLQETKLSREEARRFIRNVRFWEGFYVEAEGGPDFAR